MSADKIAVILFLAVFINGYLIAAGNRTARPLVVIITAFATVAAGYQLTMLGLESMVASTGTGHSQPASPIWLWTGFGLIIVLLLLLPVSSAMHYRKPHKHYPYEDSGQTT